MDSILEQARPAFRQRRTFERARSLALSSLLGLGRRTVTGMLSTSGQQFRDWSANYRLFEHERIDTGKVFDAVIADTLQRLAPGAPIVSAIDDTLVRKKGRRIAGTSWRRDPLGPPFANNFIWASRFLQLSLALPERGPGPGPARMIPVDLSHCPSPRKPSRRAQAARWEEWKQASHRARISAAGARRSAALRHGLERQGIAHRPLLMTADATFTCRAIFKQLAPRTHLIGYIRKDARLYRLPTAEQLRQDPAIPWQQVRAEVWGEGLQGTQKENSFMIHKHRFRKPPKIENCAPSAISYASG